MSTVLAQTCDKCTATFPAGATGYAAYLHHVRDCAGPPPGQRLIKCGGCGEMFLTKTRKMQDHWRLCHIPAQEARKAQDEANQVRYEYQHQLDALTDTGLTSDQARAILAAIGVPRALSNR